jgi:CO/xanthine dehydrogenase Mo-binding subunit
MPLVVSEVERDRDGYARVLIEPSGQITVYTGLSPHGQGTATIFAQMVAQTQGN